MARDWLFCSEHEPPQGSHSVPVVKDSKCCHNRLSQSTPENFAV